MFTPAMDAGRNGRDDMGHYDDSQGGRDLSLHADDFAPDVTDLIQDERYAEAAALLVEGDEISRSILDNDEALFLATHLVRASKGRLHLERIDLVWMVVGAISEEAIELAAIASMKAVA
jgi:hypothetical protein